MDPSPTSSSSRSIHHPRRVPLRSDRRADDRPSGSSCSTQGWSSRASAPRSGTSCCATPPSPESLRRPASRSHSCIRSPICSSSSRSSRCCCAVRPTITDTRRMARDQLGARRRRRPVPEPAARREWSTRARVGRRTAPVRRHRDRRERGALPPRTARGRSRRRHAADAAIRLRTPLPCRRRELRAAARGRAAQLGVAAQRARHRRGRRLALPRRTPAPRPCASRRRSVAEATLRASEARFRSLVQHSSDLIFVLDAAGRDPVRQLVGGARPRVRSRGARRVALSAVSDPRTRGARACLSRSRPAAGVPRRRVAPAPPGWPVGGRGGHREQPAGTTPAVGGIVVNARDVGERKALLDQLAHQAFHDPLTGLANRALFCDRVTHALTLARRQARAVTVLYLDLDDFKQVNDRGPRRGRRLLLIAARLQACARSTDTVARLGGDEFAVLVEDAETDERRRARRAHSGADGSRSRSRHGDVSHVGEHRERRRAAAARRGPALRRRRDVRRQAQRPRHLSRVRDVDAERR